MSNFVGAIFDAIIPLVGGIYIFYAHKKGNNEKLQSKMFLYIAILLIIFGVAKMASHIINFSEDKPVTKSEIENAINIVDSTLVADIIYNSGFGYKILIPKGYQYSTVKEKQTFVATKILNDESRVVIAVNKLEAKEELATVIEGTIEYLKSVNNTYDISEYYEVKAQVGKGARIPFEVVKEGVDYKGAFTMFKRNSDLYIITVSTTKYNWENSRAEIDSILNSFVLL